MPRVLIAEDDPTLRSLLRLRMEQDGHRVSEARHGREALELFKSAADGGEPFEAVSLDFRMPYLDGDAVKLGIEEFCRERGLPCPPVYMLTGAEDQGLPSRLRRAGVLSPILKVDDDKRFMKPNDIDELMKRLNSDLGVGRHAAA